MEIELSRTADYGVRAAIVLGDGQRHKARELASSAGIPAGFAAQVLGHLVRAGLVASQAGQSGGYSLTRPADDISLLDVIEALEGPIRTVRCVLRDSACDAGHPCAVHGTWTRAQDALRGSLQQTSLADLVARGAVLGR
ncbi:MAG: Rrf2 family transcriptional regulator [Acidimicrobiia bacterium]